MEKRLKDSKVFVGLKQSRVAVADGKAKKAFVAENTDDFVKIPFLELCNEKGVEIEFFKTKQELGRACGIDVEAAVAVII